MRFLPVDAARPLHAHVTAGEGLRRASIEVGQLLLFAIAPIMVTCGLVLTIGHGFGFDFHTFLRAAADILQDRNPYPVADVAVLAGEDQYVYPPAFAMLLAPLTMVPYWAAAATFTVILAMSIMGALRLLGVRDWRCYGAVFVSVTTFQSLALGTVTPLLVLAVAVCWRCRSRPVILGVALGCAIALKLFLAPLMLWLVATRRMHAAILAPLVASSIVIGSWALIGFSGLATYRDVLDVLADLMGPRGFSLATLVDALGGGRMLVEATPFVLAACVSLAAGWSGLRHAGRSDPRRDLFWLAASIGVGLLMSPVVWLNYYLLLLVPIAAAAPRFGPVWLVLPAFWFAFPADGAQLGQSGGQVAPILVVTSLLLLVLVSCAPVRARRRSAAEIEQFAPLVEPVGYARAA